jgi:excisionase family DNA binding protein
MTEFLTKAQCAEILGVPVRTIGFLIRTNQIEYHRINSKVVRIRKEALDAFIQNSKSQKRTPRGN